MASYKVLQDIEAEDKLLGPLTLRQCIYAGIAALAGWLMFICIHKHAAFLSVIFLPFLAFGAFFAIPWSSQQPTEVWALAKIRFMLKPRKRIWDQSGVKNLVTVTAPKTEDDPRKRAKNLSEGEVRSRLRALADTIDSRGWAVKNAPIDLFSQLGDAQSSDRLVTPSSMPVEIAGFTETEGDDIFDTSGNAVARELDEKINATAAARRQELFEMVEHPQSAQPAAAPQAQTQNYWYGTAQTAAAPQVQSAAMPAQYQMPAAQPATVIADNTQAAPAIPTAATPTPDEEALAQSIKYQQAQPQPSYAHLRVVQPLGSVPAQIQPQAASQPPAMPQQMPQNQPAAVTPPVNPAILELANNNDLNVATIAREAHHINPDTTDEVIVSLH